MKDPAAPPAPATPEAPIPVTALRRITWRVFSWRRRIGTIRSRKTWAKPGSSGVCSVKENLFAAMSRATLLEPRRTIVGCLCTLT
jgi:hypothetical protein